MSSSPSKPGEAVPQVSGRPVLDFDHHAIDSGGRFAAWRAIDRAGAQSEIELVQRNRAGVRLGRVGKSNG